MLKRLLLAFALTLTLGQAAWAATPLTSEAQCRALCDQAAGLIAQGDFRAALALLEPHWLLPEDEVRMLSMQYHSQREKIAASGDKVLGMVYVETKTIGQTMLRYVYLEKFRAAALQWRFTFYRPNDRWLLNQLSWKEDLEALFR